MTALAVVAGYLAVGVILTRELRRRRLGPWGGTSPLAEMGPYDDRIYAALLTLFWPLTVLAVILTAFGAFVISGGDR